MTVNEKGLNQLPAPVKIFVVSYMILMVAGLLLSLWIVVKSPIWKGSGAEDPIKQMEAMGLGKEEIQAAKNAQFHSYLKLAHIHHLGHIFMVFSVAGIYAFTRVNSNIKTQIIIWTTIVTLIHTLAFLMYSRVLLIIFGSVYGTLMIYMMAVAIIDCYRPVRE